MTEKEKFLNEIIDFWQPYYPSQKLTHDDARQMIETVGEFFTILDNWYQRYQERMKKNVEFR